ncbi:thioredoxin reductase [Ectocarpus siliculosus]|uniref:Thioredoxin reductase n=1 Tax=Ectocarpus siliculosus TaxID=2880 RepID=D8LKE0_ECTSI|nr:thioredoxin reductase [Ectocarpus siliculosus]|eukprot:CBN74530.1 thioredoxin reductase [Ectocarpus siliculosus]
MLRQMLLSRRVTAPSFLGKKTGVRRYVNTAAGSGGRRQNQRTATSVLPTTQRKSSGSSSPALMLSTSAAGDVRDTVIIGSGPAGYTAALYTARAQMKPLMIAGFQHGGQLQLTSDVENFPGYAEAVSGPDLMEDLRKQAERFGTEMMYRDVTSVDLSRRPFRVSVRKREFFAKSIIIATGAEAIWLGAEGEEQVKGRGVSTCATCDGAFYEGKEVVVVGGGDSAMEEALFLTKFASKVTIVHRRDGFRSSRIMLERVKDNPKIHLKLHRTVKKWVSEGGDLSGAELEDPRGQDAVELLPCSGAFLAIGHKPMTKFLHSISSSSGGGPAEAKESSSSSVVELDEDGFVVHKQHTMTSVEGVFACGDVVDRRYRQAISAAGMGCQAAIDCERWLAEEEGGGA